MQKQTTTKSGMFEGSVAIVTGGASGIGLALARNLHARGCYVTIADRQDDVGAAVAEEIRRKSGSDRISFMPVDVSEYSKVQELVRTVLNSFGRLDYMFNNAGVSVGGFTEDYSIADWTKVLSVNLGGVVNGVQSCYSLMKEQGFGHIVNTASLWGLIAAPMTIAYTTSKHAVVGLSRALRPEAAKHGVRVSVVCPNVVRTPILEGGGKFGGMVTELPKERIAAAWEQAGPISPERCAEGILDGVERNREIIFVPRSTAIAWWVERLLPSYLGKAIFKRMQRTLL